MPQTVVYQATLGHPGKLFVNGQFADALFGLRASIPYAIAFGQRHWLCLAEMLRLDRMLPESKATGLRRRNERVVQIAMPISHWQGLGARFALYTNIPVAEQILGQATIKRRIEARAEYVERRFRSEERDLHPLYAHLEFGHVLDFYCDESVSQWRQIAHARGKGLFAPFVFGSVVRAALAVERGERYLANGRIKYLLKDLLKRRVPAFDVDAQKAGGDLPFSRYLKSGPLRDTFDQYLMPDLVEPRVSAVTREAADWLTWNLLTFAIWRDELFANTTLGILPGTYILAPSYRYNS
jgi:asparagine synthase (glutamine-hydrolysing)